MQVWHGQEEWNGRVGYGIILKKNKLFKCGVHVFEEPLLNLLVWISKGPSELLCGFINI